MHLREFSALVFFACTCAVAPQLLGEPALRVASVAIKRVPVESSSLVSIGFARQAHILEIEFRSGAIYRYLGVSPVAFEELKRAESKGRFFARSIRGKYEFLCVESAPK